MPEQRYGHRDGARIAYFMALQVWLRRYADSARLRSIFRSVSPFGVGGSFNPAATSLGVVIDTDSPFLHGALIAAELASHGVTAARGIGLELNRAIGLGNCVRMSALVSF